MHCPLPLTLPPPTGLQRQTSQVKNQHTPTRNWPGLMERRRKGTGGSAEATRSGNLREWQQVLPGQNPRNKRKKSQGKETLSVGSCLPTEIWGRILEERLEEREGETIFCRVATTSLSSAMAGEVWGRARKSPLKKQTSKQKDLGKGLSWGAVVKTPCFQCRGHKFNPRSRK